MPRCACFTIAAMLHKTEFFPRTFLRASTFFLIVILFSAALGACGASHGEEHRYELKGKVIAVDRAKGEVTVDHEDIVGYMPAMQMPFPLRDTYALNDIGIGDRIQATLVVTDEGYWLEQPIITKAQPDAGVATSPVGSAEPQIGALVPDVRLVNQDGKKIRTGEFKGRALVVTFVYTRCPMPDQCPLMSANFAQVNGELEKDAELRKRTHLLSVTLDPEYDKPEVLRSYGAAYAGGKFDNWDFATGDAAEIRRFAEFFGLMYTTENGRLIHSLRTAIVTPDGKLYKVYHGNEWKPSEVLRDLKDAML
jgi:protein SCO1/2